MSKESTIGRPSSYDPNYCVRIVELGKQGKSLTQMACELDVHRDTIYEWANVHQDFSDALTRARQWSQSWWEDAGQTGLLTPGFNASVYNKMISCRFPADYTEKTKTELTGADGGALKVDAVIGLEPGDAYRRMLEGDAG